MQSHVFDLIGIRMKAFAAEGGSLILVALIGALGSDSFQAIVVEHWGSGVGILILNAVLKHLANLKAVKEYDSEFGSYNEKIPPVLM